MEQGTRREKGLKFNLFLIMVGIVPAFLIALIITIISISSFRSALRDSFYGPLHTASSLVNEYFVYDIIANGYVDYEEYSDHEYIESLQNQGIELTLFQGDTRLLTSLKNTDGSYNEGTQADPKVVAQVKAGQNYTNDDIKINGIRYFVFYEPIYDADGNFWGMSFAGKPYKYYSDQLIPVVILIIIVSVVLFMVLLIIVLIISSRISKTLAGTSDRLRTMADGDLDVDFDEQTVVREFNEIISSSESLHGNLSEIIGKTKNISGDLKNGAEQVTVLADTSKDGTDQIAKAMEDLAKGASTMAQSVQTINTQVVQMGEGIDNITSGADALVSISNGIKDANTDAADYINRVSVSSKESVKAVNDIATQISETNTAVDRIKDAVDIISSIASQTNLLALNASIEAARAGEAGRGFAVVAGEIGSLAEQTNKSTEDIEHIVSEIVQKSERSVSLSENVAKIISEEQSYIEETQGRFEVLNEQIEQSFVEISDISAKARALDQAKDSIMASVTDLGAISQENAAANEEVSVSIRDIADAISNIANNSNATQDTATDLDETVAYFK